MKNFETKLDNTAGTEGRLYADEVNSAFRELTSVVSKFLSLDGNSTTQLLETIDIVSKATYYEDTGTPNALVLTRTGLSLDIETFIHGTMVTFKPNNDNTGATTIKVGILAAKNLYYKGAALTGGELDSTQYYAAIYDSNNDRYNLYRLSFPAEDYVTNDTYNSLVSIVNGISTTVSANSTAITNLQTVVNSHTSELLTINNTLTSIANSLADRYTKDEADILNAIPSEAEFFTNAAKNKELYASSGIVEFGTGYPGVTIKGLWTANNGNINYEDCIRWGRQSTTFDANVTTNLSHAPIVNINGHLIKITNEHDGGGINIMRVSHEPDLPIIVTDPDNIPSDLDFGDFVYLDINKNITTPTIRWDCNDVDHLAGVASNSGVTSVTGGKHRNKALINPGTKLIFDNEMSNVFNGTNTKRYAAAFWIYRYDNSSGNTTDTFTLEPIAGTWPTLANVIVIFNKVSNAVDLTVNNTAYKISTTDSVEGWKHIIYDIDFDTNTVKFYYNGSYVGSNAVPAISPTYVDMTLGDGSYGMSIDDFVVINGGITDDDAATLYAQDGWRYGNKENFIVDGGFDSGIDAGFAAQGASTFTYNSGDGTATLAYTDDVSDPYLLYTLPEPIFTYNEHYLIMKITSPTLDAVDPRLTAKNIDGNRTAINYTEFMHIGGDYYAFNITSDIEIRQLFIYPSSATVSTTGVQYTFDDMGLYGKEGQKLTIIKEGGITAGSSIRSDVVAHGVRDFTRKYFFMLETRIESISDTDNWVLPYGNANYMNDNIPGVTGLEALGFTGSDLYSKQGYWERNNSESVGRGYDWDTLTKEQKIAFAKFPWNNLFISGSEIKQLRWILRSIKAPSSIFEQHDYRSIYPLSTGETLGGKGYYDAIKRRTNSVTLTNDFANGVSSDMFKSMLQPDGNVSNYREDIGIYAACCKVEENNFAMPIVLLQRRNSGIFHPVHNPYGSGKLYVSATQSIVTFGDDYIAYISTYGDPITSVKDCFDPLKMAVVSIADPDNDVASWQDYLDSVVNQSNYALAGSFESNRSGRPDEQYYNKIYTDDINDLRIDAKKYSKNDILTKYLSDFENGDLRGTETPPTMIVLKHVIYSGSHLYLRPFDLIGYMSVGLPTLGVLENVKVLYRNKIYEVNFSMEQNMSIWQFALTTLYTDMVADGFNITNVWTNVYLDYPIYVIDKRFYTIYRKAFKTSETTTSYELNMCDLFFPYDMMHQPYLHKILDNNSTAYTPNFYENGSTIHKLSTMPFIETTFNDTTAKTIEIELTSKAIDIPSKVVITNALTGIRITDENTLLIKTTSAGLDNPGIYALNNSVQTCWVDLNSDPKDSNVTNKLYVVINGSSTSAGYTSLINSSNVDQWVIEVYYKSYVNPTIITDIYTEQKATGYVEASNNSNMSLGGTIYQSLMGKAPVGNSAIERVRSDNGLSGEEGIIPDRTGVITHDEFVNMGGNKDGVKMLPYLADDNNQAILGILYKELRYNTGVDTTELTSLIDGISSGTILSKVASTSNADGTKLVAVGIENLGVFIFSDTEDGYVLTQSKWKHSEYNNADDSGLTVIYVPLGNELINGYSITRYYPTDGNSIYMGDYTIYNGIGSYMQFDNTITTALSGVRTATIFFSMLRTSLTNTIDTPEEHTFVWSDGDSGTAVKGKVFVQMNYNDENKVRVLLGDLQADNTEFIIDIGSELRAYDFAICVDLDLETPVIAVFIDGYLRAFGDITSTVPAGFSSLAYINYGIPTGLGTGSTYAMYAGGRINKIRIEDRSIVTEDAINWFTDNGVPGYGLNVDMNKNRLAISSYRNFIMASKADNDTAYTTNYNRKEVYTGSSVSVPVAHRNSVVGEKLIHIAGLTDPRCFVDLDGTTLKELYFDNIDTFSETASTALGLTIARATANDVNIMLLANDNKFYHYRKYSTDTDFTAGNISESFVYAATIIYALHMDSKYFGILYVDTLDSNSLKIKLMTYDSIGVSTEHLKVVLDTNVSVVTDDKFTFSKNGNTFYLTGNDGVGTELRKFMIEETVLDNGSLKDITLGSYGDDETFTVTDGFNVYQDDYGQSVLTGHRAIKLPQLIERKG